MAIELKGIRMIAEWFQRSVSTIVFAAVAIASGCATSNKYPTILRQATSGREVVPVSVAKLSPPGTQQVQLASATKDPAQDTESSRTPQSYGDSSVLDSRPVQVSTDPLAAVDSSSDSGELVQPVPGTPELPNGLPIDLATALQLTAGQNPQVAFAQRRIEEAFAQLRTAEVLWVPSLRAGVNYNKHEGNIQDVAGTIIDTSRGSLYTGFGAQAVGAGSPSVPGLIMNFHLKDAIFQPKIAEHVLGARQYASQATTNDLLLETALAYMDLLEALQTKVVAEETMASARRLAELTKSFADAGQGLRADADRAQTELSLRQIEVRRAEESVRVTPVRLARLLSHDQTLPLVPQEPALIAIELLARDVELPELVALGLSNRPELAESQLLVGEAVQRLRRELHAPLIPSVLLGLSYGGNGGGLGGNIINFADRLDFDAVAYWEVRNLGLGEQSIRNESRARVEQARWKQVQVMDLVASDIAESYAQVKSRHDQIGFAQQAISVARDSYRRNSERIRDAQGLPIETLQSIQALDQSQRQYVRAVADYNRAQFRLHRALGWPVE